LGTNTGSKGIRCKATSRNPIWL